MIHKSHSKKELYEFIKEFKIPIIYRDNRTKNQLVKVLHEALDSNLFNIIDNNKYLINTDKDLMLYLSSCNHKKVLSVKDKKQLILDCRRINQYSKSQYSIVNTSFNTEEEVKELVIKCSKYGDVPSVRKMIRAYNCNPMVKKLIKPSISKIAMKEIEDKKLLKKVYMNNLTIKYGPFSLSFE
tara:strand:+ start:17299 stop:17847 length:549 start_codon:yes stop_codon:yes gene_type:complete